MEDFHHKKKRVNFWKLTGEVLGSDKRSETRVSSSGGGGSVINGVGYVSAPTIHSSTTEKHEVWLGLDDGSEHHLQLSGLGIPLRVGQRVTLIGATLDGKKSRNSILINHNARKHWFINNVNALCQDYKISAGTGMTIIYTLIILLAGSWTGAYSLSMGIGSAFIFLMYRLYRFYKRQVALEAKFQSHLERLIQESYQLDGTKS